ncbi:hypothetical protein CHELA20_11483 [Hyphomicrobiales bacterium]|nr:hypothetical protein CHELA20_11483 [Hyphomicrobiales bacterium]CAH1695903.1 hypothetical protein CHELA41_51729 [Hyphomicrobiales bacterium]
MQLMTSFKLPGDNSVPQIIGGFAYQRSTLSDQGLGLPATQANDRLLVLVIDADAAPVRMLRTPSMSTHSVPTLDILESTFDTRHSPHDAIVAR